MLALGSLRHLEQPESEADRRNTRRHRRYKTASVRDPALQDIKHGLTTQHPNRSALRTLLQGPPSLLKEGGSYVRQQGLGIGVPTQDGQVRLRDIEICS